MRRFLRQRALGLALAAGTLTLLGSRESYANQLFETIGGTQGTGGFNARAGGAGTASTYFNPALLPRASDELAFGYFVLHQNIDIVGFKRPGGASSVDVPDGQINDIAPSQEAGVPFPTVWLEGGRCVAPPGATSLAYDDPGCTIAFKPRPRNAAIRGEETMSYATVGLVRHVFDDYLVGAFYALFPTDGFTAAQAHFADEREQFFSNSLQPELYGDRLKSAEISFAVASRPLDELSLGVGFSLNILNTGASRSYVPYQEDLAGVELDLEIKADSPPTPHFGVAYDPLPELHLTGTFHTVHKIEVSNDIRNLTSDSIPRNSDLDFIFAYYPWLAALGAGYDIVPESGIDPDAASLGVVANATYANWSDYKDRHAEAPLAEWDNTLSPSVGVRHSIGRLASALDFTYVPSPVPEQTGRTNYVDSDRYGVNLAGTYTFEIGGATFRAGIQLQGHRMVERENLKVVPGDDPTALSVDGKYRIGDPTLVVDEIHDTAALNGGAAFPGREGLQTNNPGYPGFENSGWLLGGGLHIGLLY